MKAILTKEIPKIFPRLEAKFGVTWDSGVAVAYAPYVHCKLADELPPHFVVHEQIHVDRQYIMGVDQWWNKYLNDDDFRLEEELIAYRAQYRHLIDNVELTNPEYRKQWFDKMTRDLSSSMYGNIISYEEAKRQIML